MAARWSAARPTATPRPSAAPAYHYIVRGGERRGQRRGLERSHRRPCRTYYWTGGGGTWSVGGGGRVNASDQAVNWTNGGIAVFDGNSGGAVTISGAVDPAEIEFETNGYSLDRDVLHDDSIVLPAAGGVIRVDAASATIALPIASGAVVKEWARWSSPAPAATPARPTSPPRTGSRRGVGRRGDVYVENGGALSGKGSVGTVVVAAGGVLSPGANGSGGLDHGRRGPPHRLHPELRVGNGNSAATASWSPPPWGCKPA